MLLASVGSSGTDGELKVWAFNKGFNTANNQWQVVRRHKAANSLGCVAFCPWEHGVIIVAGSVDGSLALLNCTTDDQATFAAAHDGAVNGLSWQPLRPGEESLARLVTAGSDAKVKIWRCKESALTPECELSMNGGPPHSNWVRDVDWLKSGAACGLTSDYIASVGEDKMLRIWRCDKKSESEWNCVFEHSESAPQWKCSWAPNSAMLAVSCGDNQTKVFQQTAASGDMENWEVAFAGSEAAHQ
jgi:WD40 repeat protein